MIKYEWDVFRSTVMFLTRIPVGSDLPHDPILLEKTPRYFPIVGMIVGAIHILVFLVSYFLWNSTYLSLGLAMVSTIFATGAFHEDGFADACDGFGGGWTKEKIIEIMKDSRLGTFGTVGLFGMLAIKFLSISTIPQDFSTCLIDENTFYNHFSLMAFTILCGHGISRLMAVSAIQTGTYATDNPGSKSKPLASVPLSKRAFGFAILTAFLPLFLFFPWYCWFALLPMWIGRTLMLRFFNKWIGGYTGDCLGAIQQVTEVLFYLSVSALLKFSSLFYNISF